MPNRWDVHSRSLTQPWSFLTQINYIQWICVSIWGRHVHFHADTLRTLPNIPQFCHRYIHHGPFSISYATAGHEIEREAGVYTPPPPPPLQITTTTTKDRRECLDMLSSAQKSTLLRLAFDLSSLSDLTSCIFLGNGFLPCQVPRTVSRDMICTPEEIQSRKGNNGGRLYDWHGGRGWGGGGGGSRLYPFLDTGYRQECTWIDLRTWSLGGGGGR